MPTVLLPGHDNCRLWQTWCWNLPLIKGLVLLWATASAAC